jgi:GNAT superfamily N-acetyltransferase
MLSDEYLDGDILGERLAVWEQRLASSDGTQLAVLALNEDVPLGFAFVIGGADPQWGALLDNLHVLSTAQGRGIGRQLLHRACSWVREQCPGQWLYLWVFEANARTRAFYERLGAIVLERAVVEAPGGGSVAEWRYAWPDVNALCRVLAS